MDHLHLSGAVAGPAAARLQSRCDANTQRRSAESRVFTLFERVLSPAAPACAATLSCCATAADRWPRSQRLPFPLLPGATAPQKGQLHVALTAPPAPHLHQGRAAQAPPRCLAISWPRARTRARCRSPAWESGSSLSLGSGIAGRKGGSSPQSARNSASPAATASPESTSVVGGGTVHSPGRTSRAPAPASGPSPLAPNGEPSAV